ncbi:MAG: DUF2127 domain-containing protein [Pseudomonadota bacterium]
MLFGKTLRAVALFESATGILALAAGFGLLSLGPDEVQDVALRIVARSHLNPAAHYPRIFVEFAGQATNTHLLLIAAGAAAYSVVRFVEAYGLWNGRRWAEWFAALSGAIYIPVEVMELNRHVSWLGIAALTANVAIVAVMLYLVSHTNSKGQAKR